MPVSHDLVYANFATNQGSQNGGPNTIASTTTIAPSSLITYVSGTIQVATVTPPIPGQHMLILVFTDGSPGTFLTTGNVSTAVVPTQSLPTFLFYDPLQAKYFGCASNVT